MERLNNRFKKFQPAVIAVFKDHTNLEKILDELKEKKFHNKNISILSAKRKDLKSIPYDKNVLEGAIIGAAIGVAEGGLLCWMASKGLLVMPGAAYFITSGPILSAIAGAALGANAGTIAGILVGLGVTQFEARRLGKYIKKQGVIIAVRVDDLREQLLAKKIFVDNEAVKILNPVESKSKGSVSKKQAYT
ncbi:MAG: hypothetical protein WC635_03470 [Bacteriovorax sp.]|jgi:hypothetical protein